MDINLFRQICTDETIQITQHALFRCRQRNIKLDEIKHCIRNGEIIEEYPDDHPYPSALICFSENVTAMHTLVGLGDDEIWIITAYYPDPQKWVNNYKTRKENS